MFGLSGGGSFSVNHVWLLMGPFNPNTRAFLESSLYGLTFSDSVILVTQIAHHCKRSSYFEFLLCFGGTSPDCLSDKVHSLKKFFFLKFIILFIWLCQILAVVCGTFELHCVRQNL